MSGLMHRHAPAQRLGTRPLSVNHLPLEVEPGKRPPCPARDLACFANDALDIGAGTPGKSPRQRSQTLQVRRNSGLGIMGMARVCCAVDHAGDGSSVVGGWVSAHLA